MDQAQAVSSTADSAASPRLYRISGIAIATIVGTVLAGGLLMGLNYYMLGRDGLARKTLFLSVATTTALLLVVFHLPPQWHVSSLWFTVPQLAGMIYLARRTQGAEITAHVGGGGTLASDWKALGVSVLVLLLLISVVVLVVMAVQSFSAGNTGPALIV